MIKRLFFDIETSYCTGWFWQPAFKTNITYEQVLKDSAIICICYKWEDSKKTYSLQWEKGNDKAMIKQFYDIVLSADEVVGHNGDKFDLKRFRTRCLLHGIKSFPEIKSIDTLKISRSKFKFKSNRLDNIGKELGFGGKKDTGGIELWHDIIQRNSKTAMNKMIAYCKRDVELLEKVFKKLNPYTKHKTHNGVFSGGYKWDCPECGSSEAVARKYQVSAAGVESSILSCKPCGRWFTISKSVRKQRDEWVYDQQKKHRENNGKNAKSFKEFNLE